MTREERIREIEKEIRSCRKCSLFRTRNNPVVGEGNLKAKIVFIGEAPGFNEDREGKPFCGAAGKILNELLESIDLKREEVYITNLLKCRPPQNRDPLPEEIKVCSSYLLRQLEIISPKVICPLGRYSMKFVFDKYGLSDRLEPISKIHGKIFEIKSLFGDLSVIPLYHPAVATYHPTMKEVLRSDFEVLKRFL
ncbi:MAG: uracil-DNA glycosylase [Thermoplasmata archaeon]|nr:MAG: uracil-DNA glycosylase [Thermoplasmata archaeon]